MKYWLFTLELNREKWERLKRFLIVYHYQPDGIAKIAAKKGKVFGDTHDDHKFTQQEIDQLQSGVSSEIHYGY
jgi:hypothetical protein